MVNNKLMAALSAAFFILVSCNVCASSDNYLLQHDFVLELHKGALSKQQLTAINDLIVETNLQLDGNEPASLINQFNKQSLQSLPRWFYSAIHQCEVWHHKSEGKFTCRNGKLKDYWHQYVASKVDLERREARKIARSARVAKVEMTDESSSVVFDAQMKWDLSDIAQAIAFDRIVEFLKEAGFRTFRLSVGQINGYYSEANSAEQKTGKSAAKIWQHNIDAAPSANSSTLKLINKVSYELKPWSQSVVEGSNETGVLSHNDGWPTSLFATHTLSDSALNAVMIGYLGATIPSRKLLDLIDGSKQHHVALIDKNGRVFRSSGFEQFMETNTNELIKLAIHVKLPRFDIADYQGPYVTVWLTDNKNKLIRNLLIRGTDESWLKDLRTWWRKIGRKDDTLIDAMSGATDKYNPIDILWDGFDQYGKKVMQDDLILHVEAAREHGERTYKRLPFNISALNDTNVQMKGDGELGDIQVELQ